MPDDMVQVKFTIESDIVAAFKARCAADGVSMTAVVRQWMSARRPARETKPKMLTRPQRRKAVTEYIGYLSEILCLEEAYRDSIPEQFTQRYEAADHFCDSVAEAIACLEDAF